MKAYRQAIANGTLKAAGYKWAIKKVKWYFADCAINLVAFLVPVKLAIITSLHTNHECNDS